MITVPAPPLVTVIVFAPELVRVELTVRERRFAVLVLSVMG